MRACRNEEFDYLQSVEIIPNVRPQLSQVQLVSSAAQADASSEGLHPCRLLQPEPIRWPLTHQLPASCKFALAEGHEAYRPSPPSRS